MSFAEKIASLDTKLRPAITKLPPLIPFFVYSRGRKFFLKKLSREVRDKAYTPPPVNRKKLWGLGFACGLFNAAGMFKNGESYHVAASQGAGAYLAGTTTHKARRGNNRFPVKHPFVPYSFSGAASNWMGLPNPGHAYVAKQLSGIEKAPLCPVGASISASPEEKGKEALKGMVVGMKLYARADVDFIEVNESCPNVPHETGLADESGLDKSMVERLEYLSKNFLKLRDRNLPVIVKLSTDTELSLLPAFIDLLTDLGFDGINLGNTSTDYDYIVRRLDEKDVKNFRAFTSKYGGGVSGRPLKEKSLKLASTAVDYINGKNLQREFHVIRTGGIDNAGDLYQSEKAGINLNQWFTGYFDYFANYGHDLYLRIIEG